MVCQCLYYKRVNALCSVMVRIVLLQDVVTSVRFLFNQVFKLVWWFGFFFLVIVELLRLKLAWVGEILK